MARPIKSKWFQPETIVFVEQLRNDMKQGFTAIGKALGCTRQVARYIYITKCKQKERPIIKPQEIAVTTVTLPPSVAYVRGLETYQNERYRLVQHGMETLS